jgi:hypothetical protein
MQPTRPRKSRYIVALLAASLPALAADSFGVKTGLWETTVVTNMGGMTMPADAMAKMPPAQRAQMEQMMKQMGAGAPRTIKEKSCVTEQDLKDGAFRDKGNAGQSCKYTPVSVTSKHQEITFQCSGAGGNATGRMVMDAPDSSHVNGTIDVKSDRATVNIKLSAQWLSASCAGADGK